MARFGRSLAHVSVDAPPAAHAIPLELTSLLSPFKGRGRLTLRIERVPEGARLSAGSNNGDRTWSVARDELENLFYIPPPVGDQARTLSVRIIGMEGGEASTLALIDIPLDDGNGEGAITDIAAKIPEALESRNPRNTVRPNALRVAEKPGGERDGELPGATIDARIAQELENAHAAWKTELDRQLAAAAAKTATELEHSRQIWLAEQLDRTASLEKDNNDRLALLRQIARREADEMLASAEKLWRQDEAARLAAVEAQSRALERTLRDEAQAERKLADGRHEAECGALREELAAARTALTSRETAIREIQAAAEQTNAHWRQKLAVAETAWKTGEAQRLKLTEAALRQEFEQTLAALPSRADADAAAARQAQELRDLQESVATLRETLAVRQAQLDQHEAWKAGETQRLKLAEAALRREFEQTLAALPSRADSNADVDVARQADELRELHTTVADLRETVAAYQANLDQRDAEQQRVQAQADEAMAAALASWKAQESRRMAAAEAQWQNRATEAQSALVARCEKLEATLAIEQNASATKRSEEDAYTISLARQLKTLQATLVDREAALAHAHATLEEWRQRRNAETGISRPSSIRSAFSDEQSEDKPAGRNLGRDLALVVVVAVAVAFFFPGLSSVLPGSMQSGVATLTGLIHPAQTTADQPGTRPPPAPMAEPVLPIATILRSVNVRAQPSATATLVAALPRGLQVTLLDKKGNWSHVQLPAAHGGVSDGWIFSTYLGAPGGQKP